MPNANRNEVIQLAPRDITAQHENDCKRIGRVAVRFSITLAGALIVIVTCPSCGVIPIQPER